MIRPSNQLIKKVIFIVTIIWLMSTPTSANASPPACHRNGVSMYMESDAVVVAVVTKSRRWSKGTATLHLVAKYKILDVFKGDVDKDDILIVTDTCLDKPVPREMLGYPVVENYCRGLIGLRLTGVDSQDGKPVMKSGNKPNWILFLRKDMRKGAPQLTWLEVSKTSYYGGCRQTRDDIPPEQREEFDRLFQRLKAVGR
jgi:hypothetical protein